MEALRGQSPLLPRTSFPLQIGIRAALHHIRILKLATHEDAAAAEEIFRVLMGENVEPRREFIEKHALEVKDLDI